jgi:arabinan endo-1,5-alpha-L-arabinosidase
VILQEEASLDAGEHDFALSFLNDVFEPENRDLRVDWIEIAALGDAGRTSERVSGQRSAFIDGATSNGGPREGALHFDGVDDQVVLGTPLALGEHYTVAFWIRSPNTPGHNTPIAIHGDPNVMVRVFNDSIEAIAYAASSPEWSSYDLMAERVLTAGEWHHVAFTVDETEVRIFVDAIEAAALVLTDAPQGNDTPDDELYLGQSGWDWMRDWFEGDLDDVRIYDRPLTSDEVARAMDE